MKHESLDTDSSLVPDATPKSEASDWYREGFAALEKTLVTVRGPSYRTVAEDAIRMAVYDLWNSALLVPLTVAHGKGSGYSREAVLTGFEASIAAVYDQATPPPEGYADQTAEVAAAAGPEQWDLFVSAVSPGLSKTITDLGMSRLMMKPEQQQYCNVMGLLVSFSCNLLARACSRARARRLVEITVEDVYEHEAGIADTDPAPPPSAAQAYLAYEKPVKG